jgi:hypothetical protein
MTCKSCKGTRQIQLLESFVDCTDCAPTPTIADDRVSFGATRVNGAYVEGAFISTPTAGSLWHKFLQRQPNETDAELRARAKASTLVTAPLSHAAEAFLAGERARVKRPPFTIRPYVNNWPVLKCGDLPGSSDYLRAKLLGVDGVRSVEMLNHLSTGSTESCVEVIVDGGYSIREIAQAIYESLPLGLKTVGYLAECVDGRTIRFSRPESRHREYVKDQLRSLGLLD